MNLPSEEKQHTPSTLMPALPVASPRLASSPGLSSTVIARSVAMAASFNASAYSLNNTPTPAPVQPAGSGAPPAEDKKGEGKNARKQS